MSRRVTVVVLSVALLLGGALPAAARQEAVPVPTAMAALGDSITRAFHSNCGLVQDCPANSWATGSAIDSHRTRLAARSGEAVRGDNLAVTGAKVAGLPGQAAGIAPDTGYVTILVGANDACTDTVGSMTSVASFSASFESALDTIAARAPDAAVFVATVPDLRRLWEVGRTNGSARLAWWLYGICQSMLASPTSDSDSAVQRRATVRQRVVDYNAVMTEACTAFAGTCTTDGGAVFDHPFELAHLSTIDYFHPNLAGQEVLAAATWDAGFTWDTGGPSPNTPPTADAGPDQVVTVDGTGTATVVLDGSGSTDPDGDTLVHTWTWAGGSFEGVTTSVDLPVGTHDVTLAVDDQRGGTDEDSLRVVVEAAPPEDVVVHVGDLDGAGDDAPRNRWDATVVVAVHDGDHAGVGGVVVEGSWSGGANGGGSCTTGPEGACAITRSGVKGNQSSATFSVSDVSGTDLAWDEDAGHDPDGDSDGRTIVVSAP